MGKIKFSNGVTINFDGEPTEADIEEMSQVALQQKPIKIDGDLAFKDKTLGGKAASAVFDPLMKNITGKSISDSMHEITQPRIPVDTERPFNKSVEQARKNTGGMVAKEATAGFAGGIADAATTPASYIPIPGAKLIGKIPVGKTTLGRIASNVAVGKGFGQGVKELQRMEGALEQSGKLSSPGIRPKEYLHPKMDSTILNVYNDAINPSTGKFTSKGKVDAYQQKAVTAMKTIHDYGDSLKFENPETGVIENRLPKDRQELLSAAEQTKAEIFKQYNSLAQQAGNAKIDRATIAKNAFNDIIKSPQYKNYDPSMVKSAEKVQARLMKSGSASPEEIQGDIKYLNNKMQGFYNKGDFNKANIYANYAGKLRTSLDSAIEESLGKGGYKELKGKYAALKAVESDLTKASIRQLKKTNPNAGDHFTDPIALAEVARGLLMHNPADVAVGAAIKLGKMSLNYAKNPDSKIRGLFDLMQKTVKTPKEVNPLFIQRSSLPRTAPGQLSKPFIKGKSIASNIDEVNAPEVGKLFAQPGVIKAPVKNNPLDLGGASEAMVSEGGPATDYSLQQARRFAGQQTPKLPIKNASEDPNGFLTDSKKRIGTALAAGTGAMLISPRKSEAKQPSDKEAIDTILGEVGPYGLDGMRAIASTIRNRNKGIQGYYGAKNPNVINKKYTSEQYRQAKQAWEDSKTKDYSGGAYHFFSDKDLKMQKVKNIISKDKLVFIKRVGRNNFYKKSNA